MAPTIATKISPETYPLPLTLPATASTGSATHYLYIRRHAPTHASPSDATFPPDRTLFLANLPLTATTSSLRKLFTSITPGGGQVERTSLKDTTDSKLLRPGTNALVTFVDRESTAAVLKAVKSLCKKGASETATWVPDSSLRTGHKRYQGPYVSLQQAKKDAEDWMKTWEAEQAEKAKMQAATVDDDGFTIVRRGPKAVKADKLENAEEKQEGKKELQGFYRFQIREERKRKQEVLVREFEKDRREVEERKRRRLGGFRPEK